MKIKFDKKFSERHIDKFMNSFYDNYSKNRTDSYIFDLTDTEWISNQGLLLLTGVIKYLYSKNDSFEVRFIDRGTSTLNVDYRKAKLIIQIWDIWQIWKLFSDFHDCERHIGISRSYVDSLKRSHNINYSRPEIYDIYDITPFVLLDYQDEWNDDGIIEYLKEYHRLNDATVDIVEKHNCAHPFLTNLFGEIVSKELYENFLTHFGHTFFNAKEDYAFFSVNLCGKINDKYPSKFIQDKLKERLEEEELPESRDFFSKSTNEYYNRSFISYSFLDFGDGIVNTLRAEYRKIYGEEKNDSDILKFAFKYNSSRNPIKNIFEKEELKDFIPRGLFDILSITKRYRGLLIVRSCCGKIIYDFSKPNTSIEDAFSTFGDANLFFPGTFITLYLPATQKEEIDISKITPIYPDYSAKKEYRHINLKTIIEKIEKQQNEDKYTTLYNEIYSLLKTENKTITFFSFDDMKGNQLLKKIIFFLVSSYSVNNKNNFVILNPPNKEFLEEINHEIFMLSQINRNYKIHLLPFVYYDREKNDISLYWLGIDNNPQNPDIQKLENLLYNEFSLSKGDFSDKHSIVGHILSYDEYGNVISNLPNEDILAQVCLNPKKFMKSVNCDRKKGEIEQKIKDLCISKENNHIYLCSGNYYQREYIELTKLLMNKSERDMVSNNLLDLLGISIDEFDADKDKYKFIAITSSSHSILSSWIETKQIKQCNAIFIDNYNDVSALDEKLQKHCGDYKYILVCDIIATGFLSERIENILIENGCELEKIAVVVNSIDPKFSKSKEWHEKNKDKIISIHSYKLDRYLRDSDIVKSHIQKEKIIRINPYTNVPITQEISKTNIAKVIFKKEDFLKYITDEYVQIGLLKFNNILHPYFFNTEKIIKEIGIELLQAIWRKRKINIETDNLSIFYPKKSDISYLNFEAFKKILGGNNYRGEYELERYNTEDGWKFPHTTDYFKGVINGNPVLLLDDGSCTGSSLIQMINEVSYFLPKRITVLCLIGRVGEHQREFLSLINKIERDGNSIDIEVFFGTHWHIPTHSSKDNPYINESNWFQKVINDFPNTPSKIRSSISFIDKELQPQLDRTNLKDYGFLPKPKLSYINIKKDIIDVRDEIGKIIDYRFYRESFEWFDKFMKTYESQEKREDRYKDIELLCATIIYEPHLFQKIKSVLPDVVEKLQEFIRTIIWGNSDGKKLSIENLTYKWNEKDIINLLFIVFDSKDLMDSDRNELTIDKFKELITFSPSLNYILYRLLKYFPLKADFPKDEFDLFLKKILKALCDKEAPNYLTDKKQRIEIDRYIRFLDTLPNRGDFNTQINTIRDNYIKQENPDIHDEKISFNHNISGIVVPIKDSIAYIRNGSEVNDDDAEKMRNYWFSILVFLNPIISFCTSYDRFLLPFPYEKLVRGKELRAIISKIESVIFSLTPSYREIENLELLIENIYRIQNIVGNESEFKKLFTSQMCTIEYIVTGLYSKISELSPTYKIDKDNPELEKMKRDTKIPKYYADKLIVSEIITNLRKYAQEGRDSKIKIRTSITDGTISITISNIKKENSISNGNNEGTKCLEFLSDFHEFNFTYIDSAPQDDTQQYTQHLIFEIN